MRSRLIELIKQIVHPYFAEVIADAILADGWIKPPCKVGDTVYEFFCVKGFYSITEYIVEKIVICINPSKCNLYCKSKQGSSKKLFHKKSFGKTVFFTREGIEAVLKESAK